ncbi:hypothetical protein M427DRAFT_75635 [Gonapodya prolifera JEL478]|uniref:Uncharacterized protein n=1 Tax=Gonapodya prolifera (strain JEL478) TaxID=1344416 RepID=A0A138ZXR3_GONPJ|nr:hypothetical protein M427DRAFT_75635 [Gonapodya prolifera JEL478]|eukprot:KXS09284.1 hypothetical protein M427DRAFT_75635 [Gonapodya prolifera JEL478]
MAGTNVDSIIATCNALAEQQLQSALRKKNLRMELVDFVPVGSMVRVVGTHPYPTTAAEAVPGLVKSIQSHSSLGVLKGLLEGDVDLEANVLLNLDDPECLQRVGRSVVRLSAPYGIQPRFIPKGDVGPADDPLLPFSTSPNARRLAQSVFVQAYTLSQTTEGDPGNARGITQALVAGHVFPASFIVLLWEVIAFDSIGISVFLDRVVMRQTYPNCPPPRNPLRHANWPYPETWDDTVGTWTEPEENIAGYNAEVLDELDGFGGTAFTALAQSIQKLDVGDRMQD